MIINVQMEDEYGIAISIDKATVLVENLSVPDSCAINIYDLKDDEDGTIKKAFDKQEWKQFIIGLIETGYLN